MRAVAWTVFSTPCSAKDEGTYRASAAWRRRALLRAALGAVLAAGLAAPAAAVRPATDGASWRLERTAEALYLSARVPLTLPPGVEEALRRGVPVYFVWHAVLRQPRWYWTDRRLASVTRTVRLVFQPLTQRWRLSVIDGAAPEQPAALHRHFESLDEALALARSVQRWRVVAGIELRGDEQLEVEFRVDTGQLPRPLQILPGGDEAASAWRAVLRLPPVGALDDPEPAAGGRE